ncbi:GspE/PulE family protein [Clostridium neuense]|uniref:GspE/PulE family protein n=1 Tax=Clostridium neuense TaxID=1728934 RepID=A0ABW8TGC8_9CLOT
MDEYNALKDVDLDEYEISESDFNNIDMNVICKYEIFPFCFKSNSIHIATYKELSLNIVKDLTFIFKKEVIIFKGEKSQIKSYINMYSNIKFGEKAIRDIKNERALKDNRAAYENNEENYAPAVSLTDSIIKLALIRLASDIHIEPFENVVYIRIRVDGILSELMKIPREAYEAVLIRFKIMAKMNITIKKLPQDGRIKYKNEENNYDFRVSSMPTLFGEKLVIRILYKDKSFFTFEEITENKSKQIMKLLKKSHGITLLCGPTGSGKTTTLYSMIKKLNSIEQNIITIEDPVEIVIDRINQISVNDKSGLTFANCLRNVLRQDPDVIMVGEIRDEETAEIAIRAAITGHFVLSTLHTNDTFSAVSRLSDMKVQKYLIGDALNGVISQRLVRKICCNCKHEYKPSNYEREILKLKAEDKLYKGEGCSKCNFTGYSGRKAIFEIMELDDDSKEIIYKEKASTELKNYFLSKGMKLLEDNAAELVKKGETTFTEFIKIKDSL